MRSQEKGEKSEAPLDLPADVKSGNLETAPKKVDLLIVGAGLSGAVIAERASKEQAPRVARSRPPPPAAALAGPFQLLLAPPPLETPATSWHAVYSAHPAHTSEYACLPPSQPPPAYRAAGRVSGLDLARD